MSPGIPSFPVIPAWVETGGEKGSGREKEGQMEEESEACKERDGEGETEGAATWWSRV